MLKLHVTTLTKTVSQNEPKNTVSDHLLNFKILNAPCITKTKTTVPIIKSGLFEFSQFTRRPAITTPMLIITSFEVKIILAFI